MVCREQDGGADMENFTTETYLSLGTLLTLVGILKPMWSANKELENRLTKIESDLKHLESKQTDVDKDFDKLSKKLDGVENKLSKIENSIVRIETLLSAQKPLAPIKTP